MEIRTQHTATLSLDDISELIGSQIIEIIGDDTLSPEQVDIAFDAKSKTFKISIDVTWEPSDDSDPESYDHVLYLESNFRVSADDWGDSLESMVAGERDGDSILLITREGNKIVATIDNVDSDGDLWVTVGNDIGQRVTNFPSSDTDGSIIGRITEIHYNV